MDGEEASKRAHLSTGTTPSKPSEKKSRTSSASPSSRKSLFNDKGNQRGRTRSSVISSPLKRLSFSQGPSKNKPKAWTFKENQVLIEYVALFREDDPNRAMCVVDWPKYGEFNPYWSKMADYIQETSGSPVLRSSNAARKQTRKLAEYHHTVDQAEEEYGLSVDGYLDKQNVDSREIPKRNLSGEIIARIKKMSGSEVEEAVLEGMKRFVELPGKIMSEFTRKVVGKVKVIDELMEGLKVKEKKALLDKLYLTTARTVGIDSNPADFVSTSLVAMLRLQEAGKNNLVFKLCQGFALDRPDKSGPLIPLNRMPFRMLQYCIEFFTCTNTMQFISCGRLKSRRTSSCGMRQC